MTLRSVAALCGLLGMLSSAHVVVAQGNKSGEARKVMQTCTLKVEGMACAACENRVQKVAKKVDGVIEASANHKHSTARITYDPTKTNPAAIAKAITENASFKSAVKQ